MLVSRFCTALSKIASESICHSFQILKPAEKKKVSLLHCRVSSEPSPNGYVNLSDLCVRRNCSRRTTCYAAEEVERSKGERWLVERQQQRCRYGLLSVCASVNVCGRGGDIGPAGRRHREQGFESFYSLLFLSFFVFLSLPQLKDLLVISTSFPKDARPGLAERNPQSASVREEWHSHCVVAHEGSGVYNIKDRRPCRHS